MVSESVRRACLHPDMCHRVPAFENVIQHLQRDLLEVFQANESYTVLLVTGSGTAANETVISSVFTDADHVLLINNGEFGGRLEELLQIHHVKTTVLHYEWGEVPAPEHVEERLKSDSSLTALAMVYHETSTSVRNPVSAVGDLAHQYGKTFFVDGVSAVGGEDVDLVRDHVDFCTCSSNKCLGSLAGVGIICARRQKLEQTRNNPIRVAYLNLHRLYATFESLHQTPNTPSVTMFIALEAAVGRLLREEGLANQIDRYRRCARIIRHGIREMGLRTLVEDSVASNTVTSVFLPATVPMRAFIDRLEDKGFTVYPGKGPLKAKNMFQIANMGEVDEAMCHRFLKTMRETLKEF